MSLSTKTMSCSEIPRMTLISLVRLGLLVQYRSSTLHSLVGYLCCWVRWWSFSGIISFSCIVKWLALGLTELVSQSICPALKSPPRMIVEFVLFFHFTCYLVETSVQCCKLVDRAARWPIKGAYVQCFMVSKGNCPANMRRWANFGLLLAHRLRRWPKRKPTLAQRLMISVCGPDYLTVYIIKFHLNRRVWWFYCHQNASTPTSTTNHKNNYYAHLSQFYSFMFSKSAP